jgi:hypothetical protein
MHGQVTNRDRLAADGEAFACFVPAERDWALERFVHKLMSKGMRYCIVD